MPVDRAFVIRGHGVVVTGTAIAGTVSEGEVIRVLPGGEQARVRGLESHGAAVATAVHGQRVAMNLAGIDREDLGRGHVVCHERIARVTDRLDARVELRPAARRPLPSHSRVRFHLGTAEVIGKLIVLGPEAALEPRTTGWAQIVLPERVTPQIAKVYSLPTSQGAIISNISETVGVNNKLEPTPAIKAGLKRGESRGGGTYHVPVLGRHDNGHFPVFLARGAHCDLDVLAKVGQKLHEALDRKHPRPVAQQRGDVRLLDAKDAASLGLGEATRFDDLVDLQRQTRLQKFLLGMGQIEIGKHVAAPLLRADSLVLLHHQLCLSL